MSLTKLVFVLLVSILMSACSMSLPKYMPPANKPMVKVEFNILQEKSEVFVGGYTNSDGCRDYGKLFELTDKHKTDSAMMPANEDVAVTLGYGTPGKYVRPIFKFRTVKGHQYKVNVTTKLGVLVWDVLESNGEGYSPIPTNRMEFTMPWGNAGPFCKGNVLAKNVVADYGSDSDPAHEIGKFSYGRQGFKGVDGTKPDTEKFKQDITACHDKAQRQYLTDIQDRAKLIPTYGKPFDPEFLATMRWVTVLQCMTGFMTDKSDGKGWALIR